MTTKIATPLNDLVEKIRNAGPTRLTQKQVAEKMPCNETYLGQLMRMEREGEKPVPKRFLRDMEISFEVQLKGTKTITINPEEAIRNLIEQSIKQQVWIEVLLKKVASLATPMNPSYTEEELTKTVELVTESRLNAIRS